MIQTLQPEVQKFLQQQPIPAFINGQWKTSSSSKSIDVLNPSTGEALAEVNECDAADVDSAFQAAHTAFRNSDWAKMPANDRAVILHRLADLIDKNTETLAQLESLDVGKPYAAAAGFDIPFAAQGFRYFADLSLQIRRQEPIALKGIEARQIRTPYGVCGFIFPWNFPFTLLAWGLAPALAAGNTVVVKPSEVTPLSSLYFCRLAQEAGIPAGVINVLPGYGATVGTALISHPLLRRMSFTGSPEVGKKIGEICGRNLTPSKLELGGKGAAVIFDDVDIKATAQALAGAITLNSGQVCCTATRWLVHEKIFDFFASEASRALQSIKIGCGLDDATQMGPLVSETQRQRVLSYLDRGKSEKAKVILDGGAASVPGNSKGFYVKPYLLSGSPDNICAREEIFGPAAYLIPFKQENEALEVVSRLHYGLANSVWSTDLSRANRVAEQMVAGNSWINAHNVFSYGLPYGGCNLSGMGGGVNSPETLLDYLRPQTIARPL